MKIFKMTAVTAAFVVSTNANSALVEYSYQGNVFTDVTDSTLVPGVTFTSGDSITGSFIVSDLGANWAGSINIDQVESFSFRAGSLSITSVDATNFLLTGSTDGNGDLINANLDIRRANRLWEDGEVGGVLNLLRIEATPILDSVRTSERAVNSAHGPKMRCPPFRFLLQSGSSVQAF